MATKNYWTILFYSIPCLYIAIDPLGAIDHALGRHSSSIRIAAVSLSAALAAVHFKRRLPLYIAYFLPLLSVAVSYFVVAAINQQLQYGLVGVLFASFIWSLGATKMYCPAALMILVALIGRLGVQNQKRSDSK